MSLSRASDWQIWQSPFYLTLCYFLRVGVCDSPRYPSDLSPLQSLYKCLSLCSQDRYQEWCLVCLMFPRCFCDYIAPPLPDFVQGKLSCPPVCSYYFLLFLYHFGVSYSLPQYQSLADNFVSIRLYRTDVQATSKYCSKVIFPYFRDVCLNAGLCAARKRASLICFMISIFSTWDIFHPYCPLIIEKIFQPRKTFWNNILMLTFLRSRKRNDLVCTLFCFVCVTYS